MGNGSWRRLGAFRLRFRLFFLRATAATLYVGSAWLQQGQHDGYAHGLPNAPFVDRLEGGLVAIDGQGKFRAESGQRQYHGAYVIR